MSRPQEASQPEGHWASRDPEGQPTRAQIMSLACQVREARLRLGERATPEVVAGELRAGGLDVTDDRIRQVWDQPA